MIIVDSLLYKIDQKLNKLSSNDHQQIQLEDKILALNEAQIKLIKQKLTGTVTNTGLGLDGNKKRYDDLQGLIVDYTSLLLTLIDPKLNQYGGDINTFAKKYMFYIDSYSLASKGICEDRPIYSSPNLVKHGEVKTLLNDSNYQPSFEYQESFVTISGDKISTYSDGSYVPSKLYVTYIKYPLYINKIGYTMMDGTPSTNQDSELEDYLEDELVDLAVQNLAMYTENMAAAQSAANRIMTNE